MDKRLYPIGGCKEDGDTLFFAALFVYKMNEM